MRQTSRQDPESTCSCCGLSITNSKTVRRNTHTHMTDEVIEGAMREQCGSNEEMVGKALILRQSILSYRFSRGLDWSGLRRAEC